jgi:putative hydrolase of the HAD superfamily
VGARALVLDFGGPVLLTPFELVTGRPGTPAHQLLLERGPLATAAHPDPGWTDLQEGRITERAYWALRAEEWHGAGGTGPDIAALIAHLYEPARPELVREQARALVCDARAAGHPVAILTNDLRAFHSQSWVDEIEIVGDVDVLVDGSVEGYLKPDPRLYEILADRLGVDFGDMVFLDDQMTNIRGAEALGIPSVWFDPAQPDTGFAAVRILLGLPEEERDG